MILKLSLDLPDDHAYVRLARRVSRALLEDMRVVPEDVADVELVIGELCANVTQHAWDHAGGRYQIDLSYLADRVVVTVQDRGPGFSFKDVPEAGSSRPDRAGQERIGGYGLLMVRALADRLEFFRADREGTTARAEILLRYESEADAEAAEALDRASPPS